MKLKKLLNEILNSEPGTKFSFYAPDTYRINGVIQDYDGGVNSAKQFKFTLEILHPDSTFKGKYKDSFVLAMSQDSTGLFELGDDIEKFTGLTLKDAEEYNETSNSAYVYGMCNIMNGGKDHYFWTNGMRMAGAAKKYGALPAVIEQLSHEAGVHLTRTILTRIIAQSKGVSVENEDWITYNYGGGEYKWPAVGDVDDPKNKIVMIDEETFATLSGAVVQMICNEFIDMATKYIPELKNY